MRAPVDVDEIDHRPGVEAVFLGELFRPVFNVRHLSPVRGIQPELLTVVAHHDYRDVVALRRAAAEPTHVRQQRVDHRLRRVVAVGFNHRQESLVGELLLVLIARFGDPVAEGDDDADA